MKFFRKSITLLFMMILTMSTTINTASASSNIKPTIYANPNHEGNYISLNSTDGKYEADVSYNKDFYIHVAAIDNQNNISVTHYKVHDPNISIKATPEDWTNENVTLTIEAEFIDKVILPNGIAVETDKPITYTVQENGMYTFIGLNEYGEIMDIATFVVENIDRVAKDILITPSDDKWRNKDVEVKVEFKD